MWTIRVRGQLYIGPIKSIHANTRLVADKVFDKPSWNTRETIVTRRTGSITHDDVFIGHPSILLGISANVHTCDGSEISLGSSKLVKPLTLNTTSTKPSIVFSVKINLKTFFLSNSNKSLSKHAYYIAIIIFLCFSVFSINYFIINRIKYNIRTNFYWMSNPKSNY